MVARTLRVSSILEYSYPYFFAHTFPPNQRIAYVEAISTFSPPYFQAHTQGDEAGAEGWHPHRLVTVLASCKPPELQHKHYSTLRVDYIHHSTTWGRGQCTHASLIFCLYSMSTCNGTSCAISVPLSLTERECHVHIRYLV